MNHKKRVALVAMAAGAAAAAGAQSTATSGLESIAVSVSANYWLPKIVDPNSVYSNVIGSSAQFSISPLPFMEALARVGVQSIRLDSNESLLYVGGSVGLGFTARLYERLSVNAAGFAGLGKLPDYNNQSFGLYEVGARLEASLRLSAALTLGLSAGYERLATPTSDFLDAISAGLRLKLSPVELRPSRSNLAFERVDTQAIFPVFRSWYDSEPLGTVSIRNNEDGPILNVRVSFHAPEYMGGPRLSTVIPRLERGQSTVVPLYAVFDERILALTENSTTAAIVSAEYSFLGAPRNTRQGLTLSLHHRNAMSWEDDRRAAAFVSPTDPAALWFSRYASSIVRDRMRTELPPNLQYALGIFEALKLYGMNYVIDPNSAYIDMSENAAVIDYLQYPSQTLMYRGGDCDDLSILYCSLLEASGIHTAFITIPGHIYMALDLGLTESEARERFSDPGLLIFRDGRTWAPIEITMVKDGFVKAWRVGAKQWMDNDQAGTADLFPMQDNWKAYKPSGLQNVNARFDLPDEALSMSTFDTGVDRLMIRELEPIMADYEKRLATIREPGMLNEYGMAMAKVGMLDAAWDSFAEAAKADFPWAWNNLASIAFVRKDYALSYSYYEWTTSLLPGDPIAILGMARSAYEMDRYNESTILYSGLVKEAPVLAERFSYLASVYGGSGRAWSMADRLSGSVWSRPGMDFKPPVTSSAPAVANTAPVAEPPPIAKPMPTTSAETTASDALTLIPQEPTSITVPMPAKVPAGTVLVTNPDTELLASVAGPIPTPEPVAAAPVQEAEPIKATAATEPGPIAVAPAPKPDPVMVSPAAEPGPIAVAPAPKPDPVAAAPAAEPGPIAVAPAPKPDPVAAAPAAEPGPIAVAPAPKPDPVAAAPAAEPGPIAVAPAPKPDPVKATPLPVIKPDAVAAKTEPAQQVEKIPSPARPAPPTIVAKPPEDADIAARSSAVSRAYVNTPLVTAPAPRPSAPTIQAKPPEDADVASRTIVQSSSPATSVAPPLPTPVPRTAPVTKTEPVGEPVPAVKPVPGMDPLPAAGSRQVAEPVQTPAPVYAVKPEPVVEPAPFVESKPVVQPETALETAQIVDSQSVATPDTVMEPAPTAEPEPVIEPSLVIEPDPALEQDPALESQPIVEPDPMVEPELIVEPEPVIVSEPAPALVKPVQIAQLTPAPEQQPAAKPMDPKPTVAMSPILEPDDYIIFTKPGIRTGSGTWTLDRNSANMTDPNALWAKLIVPLDEESSPSSYEFEARSTGSGKVGFGLHLHGRGDWKLQHYGGGDSILVWITRDPKVHGDSTTQIQLYRSRNEVTMPMSASAAIDISPFDTHTYRIDYDSLSGQLAIYIDNKLVLKSDGLENWSHYSFAALRAMDTAEFRKLKITSLKPGSLPRGEQQ